METGLVSDLGNRKVGFLKQVAGFVDAEFVEEFCIGLPGPVFEEAAKSLLAHIGGISYFLEADVSVVFGKDKSHDIPHPLAFQF